MGKNMTMQCKNCGGQMQSGQRFCPYCGAENRAEADKRHKKHLDAIAEKIADLMHLPKRLTLIALRIACAVIAIGLAAYIIFLHNGGHGDSIA